MKYKNKTNLFSRKSTSVKGKRKKVNTLLPGKFAKKPWAALLLFFLIAGIVGAAAIWIQTRAAGNATLYVSPPTSSLAIGDTAVYEVRMNSSVSIISTDVYLSYPDTELEFVSVDQAGSGFGAGQPAASGGSGLVTITQFSLSAISGDNSIAKVTFRARKDAGAANVSFRADSALWSIDPAKPEEANNEVGVLTGATVTLSKVLDTSPPTNVVVTAVPASVVAGSDVTLTATAQDDVEVTKIEFYEDNAKLGEDTTSPFNFIYKTDGKSGVHTFTALAYDAAGNVSTKGGGASVTITSPDTTPPTGVVLTAEPATVLAGATINLTGTAQDNVGVQRIEFYEGTTMLGQDTTSPYTFAYSTSGKTGQKSLTARAFDIAGNNANSPAVIVTINIPDTTAPAVSNFSANPASVSAGSNSVLSVNASDSVAVVSVEFYENGTLLGNGSLATGNAQNGTWTFTYQTAGKAGPKSLTAKAHDAAGNVSNSSSTAVVTVYIPGDVDGDGLVNGSDISIIINNLYSLNPSRVTGDVNGNGLVNGQDIAITINNL